ncbi:MAG TPA: FHA domain-containing protein [Polyangia bacterium]|jgi:diguanylate cyclase (GGDEF)-like protein|nr:FHA domain-containing protein [Polyangia bacterium]
MKISTSMEITNTRASDAPAKTESPRPYLMVISGTRPGELHTLSRERTIVGRSPDANVRLRDDGVSREHAELRVAGGRVTVKDLGSTNGTFVNGMRIEDRELRDGDQLTVGEATLLLFTHSEGLEAGYQRGRFQAVLRDPATRALRREVFLERLREEISFARRRATSLALLMWEPDALDARVGKAAREGGVAKIALAVQDLLRDVDVLGVLGPGRLVIACPGLDVSGARALATRVRSAVASSSVEQDANAHRSLRASIGIAAYEPGHDESHEPATLLDAAARALDAARSLGGDRVEVELPTRGHA